MAERRIKNGRALIALYVSRERLAPVDARQQCTVTDAITDLLHFANHKGFDVESILRSATGHLSAESPKKKLCTDTRCELPAGHAGRCMGEEELAEALRYEVWYEGAESQPYGVFTWDQMAAANKVDQRFLNELNALRPGQEMVTGDRHRIKVVLSEEGE